MLEENPDVANIILFPRQELRGLAGWRKIYPWARAQVFGRHPDLALDFQGLLRSALLGRLSGPQSFIGLADAREGASFLYDRAVPVPADARHAVDRYLTLADDVIGHPDPSRASLRFPLPAGEPIAADLKPDFIVLHPFARGTAKSLTPGQVNEFCARLSPRQVVLAGRHKGTAFQASAGVLNLLNQTTLPQLIWLLRRAAFVISVDSGPMHLAAALGRPLVSIHTWSDPLRVGPYRSDAWVWKNGWLGRVNEISSSSVSAAVPLSPAQIDAICALAFRL